MAYMQISSANSGVSSSSGLYPNTGLSESVPAQRKSAADVSASANENRTVSTASDARAVQQVAPPLATPDGEAARALVLARQRAGSASGLTGGLQTDSAATAQRAVAAYNTVAGQEQRFELDEVLVGIDVFA